jgi:succinate--hydroxymethylglutarate CoA-transferase
VNAFEQVFDDSQVKHLDLVKTMRHSTAGDIKVIGPAVQFSRSEQTLRFPPPLLGEHTEQVLSKTLQYSHKQIQKLKDDKIVQ